MRMFVALLLGLTAACVAARVEPATSAGSGGIGDRIEVADGLMVVPREVTEDSRCPKGTACVWAGRLVLRAEVLELGKERPVSLTLGQAEQVPGGKLSLVEALPLPVAGARTEAADYRFRFGFTPQG